MFNLGQVGQINNEYQVPKGIRGIREDVKNTQRGGVYIFWGGCRPFSPILGGVYMKLNQFGGGLFEFHSNVGGGLLF